MLPLSRQRFAGLIVHLILALVAITTHATRLLQHPSYQRLLSEDLPNNYGNRVHATIRVKNDCIRPISVAVKFEYEAWGAPIGCAYNETTNSQSGTGFCITKWTSIPAFTEAYIADTGSSSWQYTAYLEENNTVVWGFDETFDLTGKPCSLLLSASSNNCYEWSTQETGGYENALYKSRAAELGCAKYIPNRGPPAPILPRPPPSPIPGADPGPAIAIGITVVILGAICGIAYGVWTHRHSKWWEKIPGFRKNAPVDASEVAPLEEVGHFGGDNHNDDDDNTTTSALATNNKKKKPLSSSSDWIDDDEEEAAHQVKSFPVVEEEEEDIKVPQPPEDSFISMIELTPVAVVEQTRMKKKELTIYEQDSVLQWAQRLLQAGGKQLARDYYAMVYYDEKTLKAANRHLIDFNSLKIIRVLGQGSYGRVYLGEYKGKLVAVKTLLDVGKIQDDNLTGSSTDLEAADMIAEAANTANTSAPFSSIVMGRLLKESIFMGNIKHKNVVPLVGVVDFPPCIVMNYCSRGSLSQVLSQAWTDPVIAGQLTWKKRLQMAMDAANGMLHLHRLSQPIVHRNLTSRNLLIDDGWNVLVSDYDSSKILYGEQQQQSGDSASVASPKGTTAQPSSPTTLTNNNLLLLGGCDPRWMAPEVIQGKAASPAADVYAWGSILYSFITWKDPWAELANSPDLVSIITDKVVTLNERPTVPARVSELIQPSSITANNRSYPYYDRLVMMMQRCWLATPTQRPRFSHIIRELQAQLDALRGDLSGIESQNINPHSAARPIEKLWSL